MELKQVKRLFQEPETSYFLFGPRGTGKSTLAAERHLDALLIDLRLHNERLRFTTNPDLLISLVSGYPDGTVVVIDEIQKIPDLLPLIHVLIEKKRGWKFVLTGSSARKLKREGVDLLGGRALKKTMHPFMAIEIKDILNLKMHFSTVFSLCVLVLTTQKNSWLLISRSILRRRSKLRD